MPKTHASDRLAGLIDRLRAAQPKDRAHPRAPLCRALRELAKTEAALARSRALRIQATALLEKHRADAPRAGPVPVAHPKR